MKNGTTSRAEALKKSKRVARAQRGNSALLVTFCSLRQELETKNDAMRRLEILVCERSNRIDRLTETIDRLRQWRARSMAKHDPLSAVLVEAVSLEFDSDHMRRGPNCCTERAK